MTAISILIASLLLLILAYVLALRGRPRSPGMEAFKGWYYAHRGLYGGDVPENCLAAFRAARDHGYGIELDVHLLKDGSLAILHDSALKRMTGREGQIEDLTAADLPECHLNGTEHTVPLFREVLELVDGKVPLIVELKPIHGNHPALAKAACDMLKEYKGLYCLESFDPRCVLWLKKNRPELLRGQLAEDFGKSPFLKDIPGILKFLMTHNTANFLTRPDFIAYRYRDRNIPGNFLCRRLWHMAMVSWTLQTPEELDTALREGWIPIFEHFEP